MAGQADLEAALAEARGATLKPLVLIYGDQEYLVRQAYDRLLQALVPEAARAFNVEQFDGARAEVRAVIDSLATPPLMEGPKAVGVYDARYFQSKSDAGDLLTRAGEKWQAGEHLAALRQLGRVVALASWTWEEASRADAGQWAEILDLEEDAVAGLLRLWMNEALAQALRSGLEQPSQGDDASALEEGLARLLDQGLSGATLVCACSGADQRKKLFKLFHERGRVLDFKSSERGEQVVQTSRVFLAKLLAQKGLAMKARLSERLAVAAGKDLGLLEQELSKLEAWVWPRKEITDDDLAVVCLPQPEEKIFAILDALADRNPVLAHRLLRHFLASEKDARYQIFGLLCGEVRKLVLLRALLDEERVPSRVSDANAFKAQVHERLGRELPGALASAWRRTNAWAQFQALKRARVFDARQLRGLVEFLSDADVKLKSGGATHEAVFEELVMRFCGVREEAAL
jgi:DNA polymerase III delta subunit